MQQVSKASQVQSKAKQINPKTTFAALGKMPGSPGNHSQTPEHSSLKLGVCNIEIALQA